MQRPEHAMMAESKRTNVAESFVLPEDSDPLKLEVVGVAVAEAVVVVVAVAVVDVAVMVAVNGQASKSASPQKRHSKCMPSA
mmetsp:Transcript_7783/g.19452  ORF Transcript_7783/g.19452 Transcript_7783/m.19452 type:complete len:82 (+) Transcript_7783:3-248(+)